MPGALIVDIASRLPVPEWRIPSLGRRVQCPESLGRSLRSELFDHNRPNTALYRAATFVFPTPDSCM